MAWKARQRGLEFHQSTLTAFEGFLQGNSLDWSWARPTAVCKLDWEVREEKCGMCSQEVIVITWAEVAKARKVRGWWAGDEGRDA